MTLARHLPHGEWDAKASSVTLLSKKSIERLMTLAMFRRHGAGKCEPLAIAQVHQHFMILT